MRAAPGEAIAAAMPPRAWVESERHAQITDAGHARLLIERGVRRDLLEELKGDKPVRVGSLVGKGRAARAALLALERDGLVAITRPLQGPGVRIPHRSRRDPDRSGSRRPCVRRREIRGRVLAPHEFADVEAEADDAPGPRLGRDRRRRWRYWLRQRTGSTRVN